MRNYLKLFVLLGFVVCLFLGCSKAASSEASVGEELTVGWTIEPDKPTYNVGEKVVVTIIPPDSLPEATAAWSYSLSEGTMSGVFPATAGDTFTITPQSAPFNMRVTGNLTNFEVNSATNVVDEYKVFRIYVPATTFTVSSNVVDQSTVYTGQTIELTIAPDYVDFDLDITFDDAGYDNTGLGYRVVDDTNIVLNNPGSITIKVSSGQQITTLQYDVLLALPSGNFAFEPIYNVEGIGQTGLVFFKDVPYVLFQKDGVNLRSYDNSAATWNIQSSPETGRVAYFRVLADDNYLYLAYRLLNSKITVKKFDGVNWSSVGVPEFVESSLKYFDFEFVNNVLNIAVADADEDSKPSLLKYTEGAWRYELQGAYIAGDLSAGLKGVGIEEISSSPNFMYLDFFQDLVIAKKPTDNWLVGATYDSLLSSSSTHYMDVSKHNNRLVVCARDTFDGVKVITFTEDLESANYIDMEDEIAFSIYSKGDRALIVFQDRDGEITLRELSGTSWSQIITGNDYYGDISLTSLFIEESANKAYWVTVQDDKHLVFYSE